MVAMVIRASFKLMIMLLFGLMSMSLKADEASYHQSIVPIQPISSIQPISREEFVRQYLQGLGLDARSLLHVVQGRVWGIDTQVYRLENIPNPLVFLEKLMPNDERSMAFSDASDRFVTMIGEDVWVSQRIGAQHIQMIIGPRYDGINPPSIDHPLQGRITAQGGLPFDAEIILSTDANFKQWEDKLETQATRLVELQAQRLVGQVDSVIPVNAVSLMYFTGEDGMHQRVYQIPQPLDTVQVMLNEALVAQGWQYQGAMMEGFDRWLWTPRQTLGGQMKPLLMTIFLMAEGSSTVLYLTLESNI